MSELQKRRNEIGYPILICPRCEGLMSVDYENEQLLCFRCFKKIKIVDKKCKKKEICDGM